jgi:hypothetical protein
MNVRRRLTGIVVVAAAATAATAAAVVVQLPHQDLYQDMVRPAGQTVIQNQLKGTDMHQDL